MRADQFLVENNYFESRSKAQAAIEEGLVFINDKQIKKTSEKVHTVKDVRVEIRQGLSNRFVSRGGIKLKGALDHLDLKVKDKTALDVGVSTGGFSDCLLQSGAELVVGIDVGHKQVHESLQKNSSFYFFDGIHIKDLKPSFLIQQKLISTFDIVVIDVSFISLKKVVPYLNSFLNTQAHVLALVKPQFELSAQDLNKKGIVKDVGLYKKVEQDIRSLFSDHKYEILDYFESSIQGGDGNKEFFIYVKNSN